MQYETIKTKRYDLLKHMTALKLSDRKLATLTGFHYTHISRLKNERCKATLNTAEKIINAIENEYGVKY